MGQPFGIVSAVQAAFGVTEAHHGVCGAYAGTFLSDFVIRGLGVTYFFL